METHRDPFAADLDDTERDALINAVDHLLQFAPRLLPSIDGVLERPQGGPALRRVMAELRPTTIGPSSATSGWTNIFVD
ncbi:MAG: hypothetical protein IPQ15_01065 [Betaproteobacteria bacterium]|nr:hypothetical protein [Betaproteobacteria bacterium]